MPSNIEIKAAIPSLEKAALVAKAMCRPEEQTPEILNQSDTFFGAKNGRLKLRIENGNAVLIAYTRSDEFGPTRSDYVMTPVPDPESMVQVLGAAYGIRGVVNKIRTVFIIRWYSEDPVARIHLDLVEHLGTFIELEIMLYDGEHPSKGVQKARELMGSFGIQPKDLIKHAYMDELLLKVDEEPSQQLSPQQQHS